MRVWLYYRLSRDEDEEYNSLNNQRSIIENYALSNGHEIVGESFDDNVSGMHFNREGIDRIYEAVENGVMDAIVVKDLSRLGRHRTQTELFIEYLKSHNIRVLSATENIDTFNENDDLLIGIKGLVNDFYAKDGSRRVRAGLRQKQKAGLVIMPTFGYFKDKNTNNIEIVSEAAETVHLIYDCYLGGMGVKAIAQMLTKSQRKTPAQMQKELIGKRMPVQLEENLIKKYLWSATMVSRILTDESYTGTLICHKSERNKINKTFRFTEPDEQFRHENFLPQIISREQWEQVQALMKSRKKDNARAAKAQAVNRYCGLVVCGDCGRNFIGRRNKHGEVILTCATYQRYGKEHCTAHRFSEKELDELITAELLQTKEQYARLWERVETSIDSWIPDPSDTAEQVKKLCKRILDLEEELEAILMERIRDRANAERYDRMIAKREEQIAQAKEQIEKLENIGTVIRERQRKLKKDIALLDDILADGKLTEAQLRLLIDKIYVTETPEGLSLDIRLKAPLREHTDSYEDGMLTGREIEELIKAG